MADNKPTPTSTTPTAAPNKKEAVMEAFQRLGKKAMPLAVRADIKTRLGIDVNPEYISKIKAIIVGKKTKKKPAAAPTKAPAPVAAKTTTAVAPKASTNGSKDAYEFADMMALKSLVDKIGLEQVRKLLAVFQK